MKILKPSNFLLFFAVGTMLAITSCKDKSSLLIRTWKLDNLKYSTEVPPAIQATVNESIAKIKQSYSLTYQADGHYITHMNSESIKGTWKLNATSTKIISTTEDGKKTEFAIDRLTDKNFDFKAIEGKDEVLFMMVPAN